MTYPTLLQETVDELNLGDTVVAKWDDGGLTKTGPIKLYENDYWTVDGHIIKYISNGKIHPILKSIEVINQKKIIEWAPGENCLFA